MGVAALASSATYLVRAVTDTSDDEARYQMALASSIAGIGFGNAGFTCRMACRTPSRAGERLSSRRLHGRSSAGPAWDFGDLEHPGRRPLHGGDRSAAASGLCRSVGGRHCRSVGDGSGEIAGRTMIVEFMQTTEHSQRLGRDRVSPKPTFPLWWKERCRSTG